MDRTKSFAQSSLSSHLDPRHGGPDLSHPGHSHQEDVQLSGLHSQDAKISHLENSLDFCSTLKSVQCLQYPSCSVIFVIYSSITLCVCVYCNKLFIMIDHLFVVNLA